MEGYVRFLNLINGMVMVETREGYTVFEIRERCAIDISDKVSGDLGEPGVVTLDNLSKKETFMVWIAGAHLSRAQADVLLKG